MNFRDKPLTCTNCGATFIFTVTKQRQMAESGQEVVEPDLCQNCRMRDPETGRWSGEVKWFNLSKGYGFITKPDGDEIFFHRSQVDDESLQELDEGTKVTFEEVQTDRGAEAQHVRLED